MKFSGKMHKYHENTINFHFKQTSVKKVVVLSQQLLNCTILVKVL